MADLAAAAEAPSPYNQIRKVELNKDASGPNVRSFIITDKDGKAKTYSWPVEDAVANAIEWLDNDVMGLKRIRSPYFSLELYCSLIRGEVSWYREWYGRDTGRRFIRDQTATPTWDSIKYMIEDAREHIQEARTLDRSETNKRYQSINRAVHLIISGNERMIRWLKTEARVSDDSGHTEGSRDELVEKCGIWIFMTRVTGDLFRAGLFV